MILGAHVCVCLTHIFDMCMCILCVLRCQAKSRAVTGPDWEIDGPTGSWTRDGFGSTN